MAVGYQYFEVQEFPSWIQGEVYETTHQGSFIDTVDSKPKSTITTVGLADFSSFNKYHVLHESFQKVRGRYHNEPINGYISEQEFHIFMNPHENRMFIDSSKSICSELIKRLQSSSLPFKVDSKNIDLVHLASDLRNNIRGGWFGDLRVADVSSIGLFGPTVGESAEWERYEHMGNLKAVDLDLIFPYQKLIVKIMANRGIVLFANFTELEALKLILDIQHELDKYNIEE